MPQLFDDVAHKHDKGESIYITFMFARQNYTETVYLCTLQCMNIVLIPSAQC